MRCHSVVAAMNGEVAKPLEQGRRENKCLSVHLVSEAFTKL